jgi:hypothetical protein
MSSTSFGPQTASSPVSSYVSDRISSAFSNPAALATNAAFSLVPGVGALNAVSGILGGPTVGGALFGQSPDKGMSSTGYDLTATGPETSTGDFGGSGGDNIPVATEYAGLTEGGSAISPTLNNAALLDLANFVIAQSNPSGIPVGVTPYVGLSTGGAPVSTTSPVPQFAAIDYPTSPA